MKLIREDVKVSANIFFKLDELYAKCCEYAILHGCSLETAQYSLLDRILFVE